MAWKPRWRTVGTMAAFAIAGTLAAPMAAFGIHMSFQTQPANPTDEEEVTVKLTVAAPALLNGYWREGEKTVYVNAAVDCNILCPPSQTTFDLPLGRLAPGTYTVVDWTDRVSLGEFRVTNGEPPLPDYSKIQFNTAAPTEQDRIVVSLPYVKTNCDFTPSVLRVTQTNEVFTIVQGYALPDIWCQPTSTSLGTVTADLGYQPAGNYSVELIREVQPTGSQYWLDSRAFTVTASDNRVLLLDRYRVSATWRTAAGQQGTAKPRPGGTDESVLFTFFGPENWELLVKVLDGCAINGHRWVFLAAATEVEFTLTVEDLQGGSPPYVYTSPGGAPAPPLTDTTAFSCNP